MRLQPNVDLVLGVPALADHHIPIPGVTGCVASSRVEEWPASGHSWSMTGQPGQAPGENPDLAAASPVRKLFRLVQLEQVAERIVQEGLVPGAGDERDPVHLDALLAAGR